MTTPTRPMDSEMREPSTTRENMSRPMLSVPKMNSGPLPSVPNRCTDVGISPQNRYASPFAKRRRGYRIAVSSAKILRFVSGCRVLLRP